MSRAYKVYHPSDIFKEKRSQALKDVGDPSKKATGITSSDPAANEGPERPQTKVGGMVFDALGYMNESMEVVKQVKRHLSELQELIRVCIDMNLADKDRKIPNRKFQAVKRQISELARSATVQGDLLFSGRFRDKPKTLPIGENKDEVISLRIDPIHVEGLGLDRAKTDNLPATKKALEYLTKGVMIIDELTKLFQSKIDSLEAKLERIAQASEMERKSKQSNVIKASSGSLAKDSNEERQRLLNELRLRQEKAAEYYDRILALLVNVEG